MKIKISKKVKKHNLLIIIKKKDIKLAVKRNKIKRRIKNAFHIFNILIPFGKVIIFYDIKYISYQEIFNKLQDFRLKFI